MVLGKKRPKWRCGSSSRGHDVVRGPPQAARRVVIPARWTASERRNDEPQRRFRSSSPANGTVNPHGSGSPQLGISPRLCSGSGSGKSFPHHGFQRNASLPGNSGGRPVDASSKWHQKVAWATFCKPLKYNEKLERAKRFELSTPTLARLCSTTELRPLVRLLDLWVNARGPWRGARLAPHYVGRKN